MCKKMGILGKDAVHELMDQLFCFFFTQRAIAMIPVDDFSIDDGDQVAGQPFFLVFQVRMGGGDVIKYPVDGFVLGHVVWADQLCRHSRGRCIAVPQNHAVEDGAVQGEVEICRHDGQEDRLDILVIFLGIGTVDGNLIQNPVEACVVLCEYGFKNTLLALEEIIERGLGDAGCCRDLIDADAVITFFEK